MDVGRWILVALTVGLAACSSSHGGTTAAPVTSAAPTRQPPACASKDLRLNVVPDAVGEATGQHTAVFTLSNLGDQPCRMKGYPAIRLLDSSGHAVPFTFQRRGDMMLANVAPAAVEIGPRATAFGAINKYRCDLGSKVLATRIAVAPPTDRAELITPLAAGPPIDFCGNGDPGSTIDVAPIGATLQQLFH